MRSTGQISDHLREERRRLQEASTQAAAALQEGAVHIRELNERIKYLERENETLRERIASLTQDT